MPPRRMRCSVRGVRVSDRPYLLPDPYGPLIEFCMFWAYVAYMVTP